MKLTLTLNERIDIDTPSGQSLIIKCNEKGEPVILNTTKELSVEEMGLIDIADRPIAAIKAYRERTGSSLAEAKQAVDAYRNRPGPDYFDAVRDS